MQLAINIIIFLAGFLLLVKGADYFVKSASLIAKKFGISSFIIGLTLVAIGTSIPELASTIIASLKNESGIVLGQVIGSNITNLGIIGAVALFFKSIKIKKEMVRRDGYIMLLVMFIFLIASLKNIIGPTIGLIFFLFFCIYFIFLIDSKKNKNKKRFADFVEYFVKLEYLKSIEKGIMEKNHNTKKKIFKDVLIIILSGIAIFIGAKIIVGQVIIFGDYFKISKTVIGLTAMAIGATLPELGVTVSAVRRGQGGIAVGNIIGSNIVNILLILGISSIISPIPTSNAISYLIAFMILMSSILIISMAKDWKIKRYEGAILFGLYIIFLISMIFFRKGF